MRLLARLRQLGRSLLRGARGYVQFVMGPSVDALPADTPYLRRRRFEGWTDPRHDTREDDPRLTGR